MYPWCLLSPSHWPKEGTTVASHLLTQASQLSVRSPQIGHPQSVRTDKERMLLVLTNEHFPPEISLLIGCLPLSEGRRRNSWGTGKPTGLPNAADKKAHGGAGASDAALACACSADERPGNPTRSLSRKVRVRYSRQCDSERPVIAWCRRSRQMRLTVNGAILCCCGNNQVVAESRDHT